jgi:hypothetical protein
MWCWAACSKAFLAYYGLDLSQCQIVDWVRDQKQWGATECCACPSCAVCNQGNSLFASRGSEQAVLEHWGLGTYAVSRPLTLSEIQTEIAANRPVAISWGWDTGGGHALIGRGVAGNIVHYMDPWPGTGYSTALYDWVRDGDTHAWNVSLRIARSIVLLTLGTPTLNGVARRTIRVAPNAVINGGFSYYARSRDTGQTMRAVVGCVNHGGNWVGADPVSAFIGTPSQAGSLGSTHWSWFHAPAQRGVYALRYHAYESHSAADAFDGFETQAHATYRTVSQDLVGYVHVNWTTFNDYDGDGVSDQAMYQRNTGQWFIRSFGLGNAIAFGLVWGGAGLVPVPGDYNGDGVSDLAVYRPSDGRWFIRPVGSATPIAFGVAWGGPTLAPVPGDYDGDGRWDLAVYEEATGKWYIRSLTAGPPLYAGTNPWGGPGWTPVAGDYNGDRRWDLAVYHRSTGNWKIRKLSPYAVIASGIFWGDGTMIPVQGDYSGDYVHDLALFQPSTGSWYIRRVAGSSPIAFGQNWGNSGMRPVSGDYNGDGTYDLALFEPSTGRWFIRSVGYHEPPLAVGLAWGNSSMDPVGVQR